MLFFKDVIFFKNLNFFCERWKRSTRHSWKSWRLKVYIYIHLHNISLEHTHTHIRCSGVKIARDASEGAKVDRTTSRGASDRAFEDA